MILTKENVVECFSAYLESQKVDGYSVFSVEILMKIQQFMCFAIRRTNINTVERLLELETQYFLGGRR